MNNKTNQVQKAVRAGLAKLYAESVVNKKEQLIVQLASTGVGASAIAQAIFDIINIEIVDLPEIRPLIEAEIQRLTNQSRAVSQSESGSESAPAAAPVATVSAPPSGSVPVKTRKPRAGVSNTIRTILDELRVKNRLGKDIYLPDHPELREAVAEAIPSLQGLHPHAQNRRILDAYLGRKTLPKVENRRGKRRIVFS